MVRLRQAVLVARDLDAVAGALRSELGLGEPFNDPGVGHFGLRNAVMALGDTFIEVVSPVQDGTTAGRYLERRGGDGGYMVMFQLDDLESARARVKELGVRTVWSLDLDDISDDHLHPRDMGGAIVALDKPAPDGSWRWGGPAWEGKVPGDVSDGGVRGATVRAEDPKRMARKWANVLGLPVRDENGDSLVPIDGGDVRFTAADGEPEGVVAFAVSVPGRAGETLELGGVRLELV